MGPREREDEKDADAMERAADRLGEMFDRRAAELAAERDAKPLPELTAEEWRCLRMIRQGVRKGPGMRKCMPRLESEQLARRTQWGPELLPWGVAALDRKGAA